ncbi:MAG: hypothetical protein HOB82_05885 [Alphaproteobacteria bacterium]|nr:hypothetical protein [Alphaproteobacteria bacterium]
MNKHYGTQILATDRVRKECRHDFLFRSVDKVLPKGAVNPVNIFELVGALPGTADANVPEATEEQLDLCEKWEHVYRLYSERRWDDLERMVGEFLSEFPTDPVAAVYAGRTSEYLKNPPGDGWNGVRE